MGYQSISYLGAFLVLEEHHMLSQIERVAGTSAGAMLATLLSFRLDVQDILDLYRSVDFSSFLTMK
jgi:NTE family protein